MNEINFNIEETEKIDLSMDVGIKEVYPPIEDLKVTPSKEQQIFNHENSYGYDNVTVEPINLQDKSITIKSNGTQEIVSDEGYDGLNQVKVITQIDGGGSMNNYSTEETVIGTWIDGKPIYRKVVNYGNLNSVQGTKSVEHGISDIDTITNINGICYEVNFAFNIPFAPTVYMFAGITYAIRVDKTNIHIYVSDDRSVDTAIVTIEYTKTTD